ncbi:MAG TPA: phosphoribosyltransferase family protein, partial [Candidatus Binatia bacterium]|nr:phosphoribosyltransferase family protein [Candidatus Binatia bacterium]
SLDHHVVAKFAEQLASVLRIPYVAALRKVRATAPQKQMENTFQQLQNLLGAMQVNGAISDQPVLLVDDICDSGWTLMLGAILLRRAGSGLVYPFALAKATPMST